MKKYSSKGKQYMHNNPDITYGQLLKYMCIDLDDPCLLLSHSTIPCLFALSVDDIFDADAKVISEFRETLLDKMFFCINVIDNEHTHISKDR